MSSYPRWKYFLVSLVLLTSIIYSLPNLYHSKPAIEIGSEGINVSEIIKTLNHPEDSIVYNDNKLTLLFNDTDSQLLSYDKLRKTNLLSNYSLTSYIDLPDWLKSINAYPMYLGLDLKGGVHFLLQVDKDNIEKNLLREIEDDVKSILIENKHRYMSFIKNDNKVEIKFSADKPIESILSAINDQSPNLDIIKKTEKDLVVLEITPSSELINSDIKSALAKNLTILRSRVDELGVSQPILQKQGQDRIIILLPGLQDSTRAKGILGSTATLEFRLTK